MFVLITNHQKLRISCGTKIKHEISCYELCRTCLFFVGNPHMLICVS